MKLKRYEEATTWCDEGLAVSFVKCYILLHGYTFKDFLQNSGPR